jgi:hypothetical protein
MFTETRFAVRIARIVLPAVIVGNFAGCGTTGNKELTSINKDWNRLIRASHIFPVYPLTQDIVPGDIFLTDTDIEDTTVWEREGYVRFDHHITRLYPENYERFYERSFAYGADALPKRWIEGSSWESAPTAAFPSYSFTVKQGGGANVALPISGIPIGLGLMGARSASGIVTIGDSRTYGIDESSLMKQVQDYVNTNAEDIARCIGGIDFNAVSNQRTRYYLQVVSRVYTTKRVTVSMVNDSSAGVTISGGVPKDVSLPGLESTNAAANYSSITAAVNQNLAAISEAASALPGGTLKFAHVSSRSVSMDETFPQPLVIGYVGFSWPLDVRPQFGAAAGAPPIAVTLKRSGPVTISEFLKRK